MILFCKIKFQQGRKKIVEIFSSGYSNNEEQRRKEYRLFIEEHKQHTYEYMKNKLPLLYQKNNEK